MKRLLKCYGLAMAILVALLIALAMPVTAAEKVITGKVNDNFQIVSSGKIYEIDDTAEGRELGENHVGANVRVTGTVVQSENMTIITVKSYKVLSD